MSWGKRKFACYFNSMKNFLVPTDFSDCAGYALEVAVGLAERFNGHVHLMHVLDMPEGWQLAEGEGQENWAMQVEWENRAFQQLQHLRDQYPDTSMTTSCTIGSLLDRIQAHADEHGMDLIVMGSHGSSGKSDFFIGSNTQKVARSLHRPLLVIKEPLEEVRFDKVIFASNFDEREKEPFLRFKEIVKHFLPEIHLVAIHTSSLFDPPYILSQEAMADFKRLCHPFNCYTHIYKDFSVDRGVRNLAQELGANLIGISNHYRRPVKRMLAGSNVEALVNHAEIPVLAIDYSEKPST